MLAPLGLTRTQITNSAYDAYSTPLDMARLRKMFPHPLTAVLGPETKVEWGIGFLAAILENLAETASATEATKAP